MRVESKLLSLADIVAERPHWYFNVPIYQRLYVWGEDQVLMLLNDLVNAYERGDDLFFLGGTLLVEQESGRGRHFDLIDGQQRFTTLWLLCHAWRLALSPFLTVTVDQRTEPRLRFSIRPAVNRFLETLVFDNSLHPATDEEATRRMRISLDLMRSLFAKRPLPLGATDHAAHLDGLAKFVYGKVKLVVTTVPRETDLNKLFEVINNRGVQLQHHEILKARMLDSLSEVERGLYAVLWEACADMENFVERNLIGISGLPASEVTGCYERREMTEAQAVLDMLANQRLGRSDHQALALEDILTAEEEPTAPESAPDDDETDPTWVRSILGFPLFLQHALRIWLLEHNRPDLPRLLDRELLALFEAHFFTVSIALPDHVRSFIGLLWRLRVVFDERIIKWADRGEEEVHLISSISVSTSNQKRYMSRSRESDADRTFSLLQSMLYHSQEITTQYWVTPLLLFMHRNPAAPIDRYRDYLRHLDNHLLGSAADESLAIRTLSFMKAPWQRRDLIHRSELAAAHGVGFAHYWFYKLEFVLWFQNTRTSHEWNEFRLTAKSSVEHISPQKPTDRDDNRVAQALDHFGNLALVSRSLNSEYGNLPYNEKRQRFLNKKKARLDSLKMDLIYEHERWDDGRAFAHQAKMIECLDSYCRDTPSA